MIWTQITSPTLVERILVISSQISFTVFIISSFLISRRFVHKFLSFLEEEAIQSYTQLLEDIDTGNSRYIGIRIPEVGK